MIITSKKEFPSMTVAMDLTPMDQSLINFSAMLAPALKAKAVDFIHVVPIILPEDARGWAFEDFLELDEPLPAKVQNYLDSEMQKHLHQFQGLDTQVKVLNGRPYWVMVNRLSENKTDLLVLGKKQWSSGSGLTSKRVARNTNCALCFVPEKPPMSIKNILVPIDFSKYASRAIINALSLKQQYPEAKISCLHVVDIPAIAANPNLKTPVLRKRLEEKANQYFAEFIEHYSLPEDTFSLEILVADNLNIAKEIITWAEEHQVDLIIQGAVGHSFVNGILFGSITERLVSYEHNIPVLVIR